MGFDLVSTWKSSSGFIRWYRQEGLHRRSRRVGICGQQPMVESFLTLAIGLSVSLWELSLNESNSSNHPDWIAIDTKCQQGARTQYISYDSRIARAIGWCDSWATERCVCGFCWPIHNQSCCTPQGAFEESLMCAEILLSRWKCKQVSFVCTYCQQLDFQHWRA